ncbi:hypothetical protein [Lentibacillus sp. CBA3610]|uniref:hypothetical protein n=1 Tax=Lentibacillus sp. CBA3610 TaxID=2518176 RepID=UPI001595098D|nr:hypothetical protein [Lentibacillus sp. CBA3610]QKY70262.1 hypothetical protein Len3610_12225 [Lentibacillus sp. CBA3610]
MRCERSEKYGRRRTNGNVFQLYLCNRMIDLMRKENNELDKLSRYANEHRSDFDDGNYYHSKGKRHSVVKNEVDVVDDHATFWREVRDQLSENQWNGCNIILSRTSRYGTC